MRNKSLVRVLKIQWRLEQRGRYTLGELAREFGVCERTIRRDLEALEAAGVPISHDTDHTGHNSTWWLIVGGAHPQREEGLK